MYRYSGHVISHKIKLISQGTNSTAKKHTWFIRHVTPHICTQSPALIGPQGILVEPPGSRRGDGGAHLMLRWQLKLLASGKERGADISELCCRSCMQMRRMLFDHKVLLHCSFAQPGSFLLAGGGQRSTR